jgi:hypothetical protein
MRHLTSLLVLVGVLSAVAAETPPDTAQPAPDAAVGQPPKPTAAATPKQTPPAKPAAPPSTAPDNGTGSGDAADIFKPSEDISEDAAVPYPADI